MNRAAAHGAAPTADPGGVTALPAVAGGGDRAAAALARAGALLTVLVPMALITLLACQSATSPEGSATGLGALLVEVLCSAAIAVAVAAPVGAGAALFATRIAPRRARRPLGALLDVLAAVPAVAYALLAAEPLTGGADGPARTVVRGLVLAVIVTPTIASGAREVFARVPSALVEASLALGATRWEMIRQVVLPSCARALRSMTALALSRALAEALALTVLLGGVRPDQLRAIPARAASRSDVWRLTRLADDDILGRLVLAALIIVLIDLAAGLSARALVAGRPPVRPRRARPGRGIPAELAALDRALDASPTAVRLPRWTGAVLVPACLLVAALLEALSSDGGPLGALIGGAFACLLVHPLLVLAVEGPRSAVDAGCRDLCAAAFALAVLPLVVLLARAAAPAGGTTPAAPLLGAVVGTLVTITAAIAVSVPVGLACAVWAAEYAECRAARIVSSLTDAAVSAPSLVAGLLALALRIVLVGPGRAPAAAGAVLALCALMIPSVARGAVQMLGLVPAALRWEALALGADRWRVILRVVLPTASAGLVSSTVLAVSRAIGAASLVLVVAGPVERPSPSALADWIAGAAAAGTAPGPWTGVLCLVAVVVALDLVGRAVAARIGPKDAA